MARHFCLFLLLIGGVTACGRSSAPAVNAPAARLTVFAAASLTRAFTAVPTPGSAHVTYSFAGSQALVTQIAEGAPADVVATADEASMAKLVTAGLVDPPVVFAANTIVIAVAPGNPKRIAGPGDLSRPDVAVVLADPNVPVGAYAKQALDAARIQVSPRSLELDARATLGRVERGDADAAIVYATDVRASPSVEAVAVPEAAALRIRYPIAVVRTTKHREAAAAFVTSVRTGPIHDALMAAGFTKP